MDFSPRVLECTEVELDIPQESGDSGGWDDMFSWVGAPLGLKCTVAGRGGGD